MFKKGAKTMQEKQVIIDLFLDHETAEKFKDYTVNKNIDGSKALVEVLEHGMANYWLFEFKRLKENYLQIEPLFNEYKKDNEALLRLERENERLKKSLENKHVPDKKGSDQCSKMQEVK